MSQTDQIDTRHEQPSFEALSRWLSMMEVYHHAINVVRCQLPQTATLVENSVREMSSRFADLSSGIKQQSNAVRQISEMANSLEFGNEQITLEEFTNLFSETLSNSIEKIMFVSKRAITMVYMLDEAMKSIATIESFVSDIRNITKKANLLALNASIEAARAGELGKGFSVVADEVKQVSETIRQLSDSINERINVVGQSVRDGYEVLSDVATTDMSENIMAQDKLNTLMDSLIKQKQNFSAVLQDSASASDEISNTISGMVMSLQFQDRTSQYVSSSVRLLEYMDSTIAEFGAENRRSFPDIANVKMDGVLAEKIAQQFSLSEFERMFRASINGTDFDNLCLNQTAENTISTSAKPEMEDIELF